VSGNVLARDLLRALDPVSLCSAIGMEPDPWQVDALRSKHPRQLWNCCRQSGKSTTASVVAVHQADTVPNSVVLIVSAGLRQSQEVAGKVRRLWGELGLVKAGDNQTTLTAENGSRVISLPASEGTVRGFSADLLILDEASRIDDEMYRAVTPMLAVTGGRLIALSTPAGKRGWWWDAWENGGPSWERYRVPATEVQRISREFLDEELRTLGRWAFEQEYMCSFQDSTEQFFRDADIAQMLAQGEHMPGLSFTE
jgi:Terminase large subunit, T4likevirus-type, N-terminal